MQEIKKIVNKIPIIINLILFHHFFLDSSSPSDLIKSHIAKKNDTIDIINIAATATAIIVCNAYHILPGFAINDVSHNHKNKKIKEISFKKKI
jgi:hypothetical protein